MKKYLKIFVVCFALVALLTVSCFASSVQTTSTTAIYGHYISPGDYVFSDVIENTLHSINSLPFQFISNGTEFTGIQYYASSDDLIYFNSSSGNVYAYQSVSDGWIIDDYRYFTVVDGFYIYDPLDFQWWQSNVTRVSPGYDSNLLDGFFSSFTMIGQWISGATSSLTTMFWSNNSLTFLGTLAVSALAFAVAFLIIGLISRFLRFRG